MTAGLNKRLGARLLARIVLASIFLITVVCLLGVIVQGAVAVRDGARIDPPGVMLTMGDNRLYVHCTGPREGGGVILLSGMGVASDAWITSSRTSRVITACAAMTAPGPDSAHLPSGPRMPGRQMVDQSLSAFDRLHVVNRFGGLRLLGPPAAWIEGLQGDVLVRLQFIYMSVSHMRGAASESAAWRDGTSTGIASRIESLGDLPLTILVADNYPGDVERAWIDHQREFASLSTATRIVVIEGAGHYGLIQLRDYAERVAEDVRRMSRDIAIEDEENS